jgi:predicted AAA+ superfamily ATPase
MYIARLQERSIKESLTYFPVVAITGPRQCGKSTLAKEIMKKETDSVYLDLERPSDLARLENAELFLTAQKGKLICIDEVQRMPNLFPLIRSLCDEWGKPGAFLILGSASRDLLQQSSETLAGRISYHRLTPFLWDEIRKKRNMQDYISFGAFPGSIIATKVDLSFRWRENFISTFLERDIRLWTGASPVSLRRLWTMLAHENGGPANYSRLASALGVSDNTIRNYIDLLSSTYMVDAVPPHYSNLGKRLIKAPKVYLSDSGITAALLNLKSYNDILGHPGYGALWEQVVLSNIRGLYPGVEISHYRTGGGAEIDFVAEIDGRLIAIECKASANPTLSKGNYAAIEDINPDRTVVIAPVDKGWPLAPNIEVMPLKDISALSPTTI